MLDTRTASAHEWHEMLGPLRKVAGALIAAMVVTALYVGREVFVPIALAILLSFVLAPMVRRLRGWRLPRALAVVLVVAVAFAAIFAVGGLIASQLAQLAGDLPQYQQTMRQKVQSLRGATAGGGALDRAADILQDLGEELDKPEPAERLQNPIGPPAGATANAPIPVEVRQPDPGALSTIGALIGPLIHPLAMTVITIIFVIFILLQREDLRNRLIRLAGAHDLQQTTLALDDAAHRLSRLLLTQLALNAGFGIVIGLGLWAIGVPSPALWGVLAAILRFVPYIGSVIAAAFPMALAAAVDPGWSMLAWTAALFLVVEPLVGHILEPLAYGHSTGLSPVALVVSATFWTWLWGPIGLVLAAPLTVCLVVLGRHVERLEFLDVMLGDRPALSPPEIFYQRMLAGDPNEAADQAEEFLKQESLSIYYDDVALKGLHLAQADAARGAVDFPRMVAIRNAVGEVIDDLGDHDDAEPETALPTQDAEAAAAIEVSEAGPRPVPVAVVARADLAAEWQAEQPVLCIAGRNPLDEAAAAMLAQLLAKHGLGARVEPASALATANLFRLDAQGVALVCLSTLDTTSGARLRYAIRRVRRKLPDARVLLGAWGATDTASAIETLGARVGADQVATTFRQALDACVAQARAAPVAALPTAAAGRADAVHPLHLSQRERSPASAGG